MPRTSSAVQVKKLRVLKWSSLSTRQKREALSRPATKVQGDLNHSVVRAIARVRKSGDSAVHSLTKKFDKVNLSSLEVSRDEKDRALDQVSPEAKKALARAFDQIRRFHEKQRPNDVEIETSKGLTCRRLVRSIERVGLYIPAGSAPLPSTVLMLGVPSMIAGCSLRVLCSPPQRDGSVDPHIVFAANLCGIEKMFKVGGIQAIAAMAYGTQSIPKVDKIFGPGNAWVTEAKMRVASDPAGAVCDMPAGPSEVMVIADETANPDFVSWDLLSQAEHGPDSQVVLVATRKEIHDDVFRALKKHLKSLPRKQIAIKSLEKSLFFIADGIPEAIAIANQYAPEHLILQVDRAQSYISHIQNAGSVFLGPWSPESVGDYASGTNHVLPTYGYARAMGGVSLESFMKYITFQELTPHALRDIGPTVKVLAQVEQLQAHAEAVGVRLSWLTNHLLMSEKN